MFDWINGLVGSHSPLGLLCLTLFPGLVPLHVMADAIIALSYYTIPLAIISFARNRRDLVYSWLVWATALFITACGTGHAMDIWVLRYPHYDAHVGVKLFTALASAVAAIGFVLVVPRALTLPSLADLRTALEAARAGQFTDAQRLRATYEHAFVGIAEVDQEGRYLRVNEHFCSITGYRADELLGRPFHDIAHPEDRASCLERFQQQMRGELPAYSYEKRCIRKDGTLAWIELEASVVNDERGAPLYGIRILRDITERKQGEERQQIMMHELNHRVRNTLAIVQSISSQTLKAAAVDRGVAAALTDRLVALAGAHTILSGEQWAGRTWVRL